jgi:AcrR family transcriptional regulator
MGKQERGIQTVQRVLDGALVCFTTRGVYAATIHELADEAKVSIGSLYHHFGSRDRIALALYCRCQEKLWQIVTAAATDEREARVGIQRLVRAYLRWSADHRDEARFVHQFAQSEFVGRWRNELGAFHDRLLAPLFGWLAARAKGGEIVELSPALLEVVVLGPPSEFVRRWLADVPGLELEHGLRELPDVVWRSVARSL